MTAAGFRRLALSMPESVEVGHMGHPDFRAGGKIFATLGYPDDGWAMVELTPEQQEQATDPTLFIHSRNQSTTQWISMRNDGSNGIIDTGSTPLHLYSQNVLSYQIESGISYVRNAELRLENQDLGFGLSPKSGMVAGNKALTAGAATDIILVSMSAGEMIGGSSTYTVYSNDAVPDYNARSGTIQFQMVNDGGTEACTIAAARDQETEDGSSVAGSSTLTYTWTTDTSPTNGCYVALNAASGLTETVLAITYQVQFNGSALAVVAQQ